MICKALSERFQTVKMPNWVMCPNMEGWDGGNQTYGHFQKNSGVCLRIPKVFL